MNTEQISEHAEQAARKIVRALDYMHPSALEPIIQSAITAANAELQSHKDRVQEVMPKIAGLFGIEHPIQLIAAAENDSEDYFDILVKLGGRRIADLEQRLADDAETFAILAGERDFLKGHVADLERQLAEATSLIEQRDRQLGECTESAQVIRQWLTEATTERDQLRAANAEQAKEIERLREQFREDQELIGRIKNERQQKIAEAFNATQERDSLRTQLADAQKALVKYGWHRSHCLNRDGSVIEPCTCGFAAAVAKEDKQPEPPRYYLMENREGRRFVGNSAVWWRPDGRGYTCHLDQAGQYSEEEAQEHRSHPDLVTVVPVHVAQSMVHQSCNYDDIVQALKRETEKGAQP